LLRFRGLRGFRGRKGGKLLPRGNFGLRGGLRHDNIFSWGRGKAFFGYIGNRFGNRLKKFYLACVRCGR
jgi:hypothetical protein